MTFTRDILEERILPLVSKPGQYVSPFKEDLSAAFQDAPARICVVSPAPAAESLGDARVQSLFASLRAAGSETAVVDLSASPAPDMREALRKRGVLACGMGASRALAEYDVVVLLVDNVLDFPEALSILDLGGVRKHESDRPIVLLAGDVALEPFPGSTHADALLVGDPEAFAEDVIDLATRARSRTLRDLEALARQGGVNVPGTSRASSVTARWLHALPAVPSSPVVPTAVHLTEGLVVELSRPAAMPTRSRVRSQEAFIEELETALASSGHADLTLVEGSPRGDLAVFLEVLNQRFSPHGVSIRIREVCPSQLVPALARELLKGGRSHLTFAPVAVSARLREVLGRPISGSRLQEAAKIARRGGWASVHYRVWLGTPGETPEDLEEGLLDFEAITSAPGSTRVQVELVPYVPDPREGYEGWKPADSDAFRAQVARWRERLQGRRTRVSGHPPEMAWAALALRADAAGDLSRRMAKGPAFRQSDPETFDAGAWREAAAAAGLPWPPLIPEPAVRFDLERDACAERSDDFDQERPAGTSAGRPGALSMTRSTGAETTRAWFGPPSFQTGRPPRRAGKGKSARLSERFRVRFSKSEPMRFASHLDVTRAFDRAFRKTQMPVAVSQGKDRKPKVSFGPPLPLGMTSGSEYFDVAFRREVPESFQRTLNEALPEGLAVVAVSPIRTEPASLNSAIQIAEYEVAFTDTLIHDHLAGMDFDALKDRLEEAAATALAADRIEVNRVRGETSKTINARPSLLRAEVVRDDGGRPVLGLRLTLGAPDSVRPETLTTRICPWADFDERLLRIHRSGLYIPGRKKDLDPLDVVRPDFAWWRQPVRGGAAL